MADILQFRPPPPKPPSDRPLVTFDVYDSGSDYAVVVTPHTLVDLPPIARALARMVIEDDTEDEQWCEIRMFREARDGMVAVDVHGDVPDYMQTQIDKAVELIERIPNDEA